MKTSLLALLLLSLPVAAQDLRAELTLERWRFQPGHVGQAPVVADWVPVTLPYVWTQTWLRPKEADATGWAKADLRDLNSGWYETDVTVPAAWQGRRVELELRGVQCDAAVYVGERKVAELQGPDGRVDLTADLPPGRTTAVRLWVTRWWEGTDLQRAQEPLRDLSIQRNTGNQWFADESAVRRGLPAGIAEGVTLLALPPTIEITNVVVQPSFRRRELRVQLTARGNGVRLYLLR